MHISRREFVSTVGAFAAAPYVYGAAKRQLVYVGTYTGSNSNSKGIYLYEFAEGKLEPKGLAGELVSPSFLVIHPNRKWLYAVNEVSSFQGQKSGGVTAFAIDSQSGKLQQLNQVSSKGDGPCFVSVDRTGKNALVANYGGGSVAVLPLQPDGKLREASAFVQHTGTGANKRQQKPHAHSINLSPDNRFAIVADLGLDQLIVYAFDASKGTLTAAQQFHLKPGSGPRHFTFHPDGKHAYVINEIASTVTALSYDAKTGAFTEIETVSTIPSGFTSENSTAEVLVHPSGKYLYGSNRGHDSIAIFAIDTRTGKLTSKGHMSTQGQVPRNFRIDPTGTYLIAANQKSNNLVVFRLDPNTGGLHPTGQSVEVGSPVCIKFL